MTLKYLEEVMQNPELSGIYTRLIDQLNTVYESEDIASVRYQSLEICKILNEWNIKMGNYFEPALFAALLENLSTGFIKPDKVFFVNAGDLNSDGITFTLMWNLDNRKVGGVNITQYLSDGSEKVLKIHNTVEFSIDYAETN